MVEERPEIELLVEAVCRGAGYRNLDRALVRMIAAQELAKGRRSKEAVKATRNKLHQIAGAYQEGGPDWRDWLHDVQGVQAEGGDVRSLCRRMMAGHASSRERLPVLDSFYATVFAGLAPRRVLDLACGINALALPWMPLNPACEYIGCDVYLDQAVHLRTWLALMHRPGAVFSHNLLGGAPPIGADVALLLKTIPCLEQADRQAGRRLIDGVDAPVLVISYPVRSLGGNARGMVKNYSEHFGMLVDQRQWRVERFEFETELVFRVWR